MKQVAIFFIFLLSTGCGEPNANASRSDLSWIQVEPPKIVKQNRDGISFEFSVINTTDSKICVDTMPNTFPQMTLTRLTDGQVVQPSFLAELEETSVNELKREISKLTTIVPGQSVVLKRHADQSSYPLFPLSKNSELKGFPLVTDTYFAIDVMAFYDCEVLGKFARYLGETKSPPSKPFRFNH